MLLMLNVTLVGCCSLSDSVYVSQIPQRLTAEKEKKMTTFSIFNEKYYSQESSHFSFAVLFPSVKLPEENK